MAASAVASATSSTFQHDLPMFVLMQPYGQTSSFFNYGGLRGNVPHSVSKDSEKGVFNPLAKIEVVQAKIDSLYVHLKFSHTGKYFAVVKYPEPLGGYVVANSDEPEEDKRKPSCTLFHPSRAVNSDNGDVYYYLTHVQTGWQLHMDDVLPELLVNKKHFGYRTFRFVDWETIVKLPEQVAFKGDNGKYLRAHQQEDHPYLQFSSDDQYDIGSVFHIEQRLDGYVRIKSMYFEKYWSLSPSWIWVNEDRDGSSDRLDDVFWPCKVNDTSNTIALRSAANNRYCARLSKRDGKNNCLNAAVTTIDKQARLEVEELVSNRKIIGVEYRMDEAGTIEEKPFAAGQVTVENKGDLEASMAAEVGYENEKSVNFSHGFSVTAGATATISATLPFVAEASLQVHVEATKSFEWGHTSTTTETLKATGTVRVPGRHSALVHCVATKGTCRIPFSYTQVETSTVDEEITREVYHDGVFTGTNAYNFHFVIEKAKPM